MKSITITPTTHTDHTSGTSKSANSVSIWERYIAFTVEAEKKRVVWYLKILLIIPCGYMVLSIIAMASLTPNYLGFVGLCMLLFFANIMVHIAEVKGKVFVFLYYATILTMIAVPLITYLTT